MKLTLAQKIGGRQTVRTLLVVVLIYELCRLVAETQGDFANGSIFYLSEELNIFNLGLFGILFTTSYLLGKKAGKEIILDGKNFIWIGIKYALFTAACGLGYLFILYAAKKGLKDLLPFIFSEVPAITLPLILVWLWSVWRIQRKGKSTLV